MNCGKKNEDIISVKTLLDCAPCLPMYEEVMAGDKKVTHRIIVPFERDMEALGDVLSWEYCHSMGSPLTEEEAAHFCYYTFQNAMVKIRWNDYPDQTERLKRKRKSAENQQEGKKRTGNRKLKIQLKK